MNIYFFDIESRSPINIKTHHMDYINSPLTEMLCLAIKALDGEVITWEIGEDKYRIKNILGDSKNLILAHNGNTFDFPLIENQWKISIANPLDTLDIWMLYENEGKATRLSLDAIAKRWGLAKDTTGANLISTLSMPKKKKFYTPGTDPGEYFKQFRGSVYAAATKKDYADLLKYNINDVKLLEVLFKRIPFQLDYEVVKIHQKINKEGVNLDANLIQAALDASEKHKKEILAKTGKDEKFIASHKFMSHVKSMGLKLENTQEAYLSRLLKEDHPEEIKSLLIARQAISSKSEAKLKKFLSIALAGKVKNFIVLNGAHLGRNTSVGPQFHSMDRGHGLTWDALKEYQKTGAIPYKAIPDMIRASICPNLGYLFCVTDLSSIEARLACWYADDREKLQLYRDGKDRYRLFSCVIFKCPESEITDDRRKVGKEGVLSLNYQAGCDTFAERLFVKNIKLPDGLTAMDVVNAYRDDNPLIAGIRTGKTSPDGLAYRTGGLWKELKDAADLICEGVPSVSVCGGKAKMERHGKDLWLKKPSGLYIYFRNIRYTFRNFEIVKANKRKSDAERINESFFVEGKEVYEDAHHKVAPELVAEMKAAGFTKSLTFGASTSQSLYGGKLLNALCQGFVGDYIKSAMKRIKSRIAFDIHDELVCEIQTPEEQKQIISAMTHTPSWAKGLPIEVESNIMPRFAKIPIAGSFIDLLNFNEKLDKVKENPIIEDKGDTLTDKFNNIAQLEQQATTRPKWSYPRRIKK